VGGRRQRDDSTVAHVVPEPVGGACVSNGGTNAYLMVAAVHTCFHSPPSTHLVVATVNTCF
jgi:hypothetical protein